MSADLITALASEFATAGKQAGTNAYRGLVQHTSGVHKQVSVNLLNTLAGNYDWRGATAVKRLYREAGLQVSEDFKDLPDQVRPKLACMEQLCQAETRAWDREDSDEVRRVRDLETRLLHDHLLQQVPALCERIRERATGPFYQGMACLTQAYLEREAEAIPLSAAGRERIAFPLSPRQPSSPAPGANPVPAIDGSWVWPGPQRRSRSGSGAGSLHRVAPASGRSRPPAAGRAATSRRPSAAADYSPRNNAG